MKALEKVIIGYARYISTLAVESKLPEQAAAELTAMQARIEKLEEVARVAGFIELNRHNYLFNGRQEADKASVYYMDLLKEKLDALKGDK